ncbi:hypothetical protein [Streptomyces sp. NPDC004284]|uniref:hypothetical protein n=1 Tax=Streptomyces sp. NPDC004284 TaxID=3364695 RepID=UPI0036A8A42A
MTPTETAEIADERVLPARLPGDAVDAPIDGARRGLRPPPFRERFVECAASARREQTSCERFLPGRPRTLVTDREVRRRRRLVRAAEFPGPSRVSERRPLVLIAGRITFQATPVRTDTDAHRPGVTGTGHRTAGRS